MSSASTRTERDSRTNTFISTAVALMNRLSYPRKFALISLLFALPLLFVVYQLMSETAYRVRFARKELQGTAYLRPLHRLMVNVSNSRRLVRRTDEEINPGRADLERMRDRIEDDVRTLTDVDGRLGRELDTSRRYESLLAHWRTLREQLPARSPRDTDGLHQELLADIRGLMKDVGDTSNLILDPDLDSYYLMDAVLLKLPDRHRLIADHRIVVHTRSIASPPDPAPSDDFARFAGLLEANLDETTRGIRIVFDKTRSRGLRQRLEPAITAVQAEGDRLTSVVRDQRQQETKHTTLAEYDESLTRFLDGDARLWEGSIDELDGLLKARITNFLSQQCLILTVTAVALLLVVYLWIGFYVAVMRTVASLERATGRMIEGRFDDAEAVAPTGDELGKVVVAFNTIGRQLRSECKQAQQANKAKGEFLANMSHEIRTPMNGIVGMTELMFNTPLTAEQREYLGMVKSSADSLLRILNDILDFSKIEAGKLELESTDFSLRDCVSRAGQTLTVRAADKGLELACRIAPETPDQLLGDPLRLRQILVNLVGNAIKFTERGEVMVDVRTEDAVGHEGSPRDGVTLHFTVRDTGIGIPADKRDKVFGAFDQVDSSTTRKYGGTGLGLSISSQLVRLMGGRIWLESEVGHGTTFHFTAEFGRSREPLPREPANLAALTGLPTLVVDDNATNRRILQELLIQWGMAPDVVAGGREAIAALTQAAERGTPFRLVLLDCMMPEMDGFSLAEQINATPSFGRPVMMMVSSAARPADAERCRMTGITRYITKPFVPSELLAAIIVAFTGQPNASSNAQPPATMTTPARLPPVNVTLTTRPPLKILLAEDNAINQRVAIGFLNGRGHRVIVANNGREAMTRVQREPFDLVLMDRQMPEMDGLEATVAIRAVERSVGGHVPIIAMTAAAMKGDREQCLAAGMDGYVSKPIDPVELFRVIDQCVPESSPRSVSPAPSPFPSAPSHVINLDVARQRIPGGDAELPSFARLLLEESARLIEEIKSALQAQDRVRLQRAAHTLRGSADLFDAAAVSEVAMQIELLGKAAEFDTAAALLPTLEEEAERLTAALEPIANAVPS